RPFLIRRAQAAADDQNFVPSFGRGRVDPVEDLREKQIVQVRHDDADIEGAALDQAARDGIRSVAEDLGGDEHGLAAGWTDRRVVAHDAGDDGLGDAGLGGDVNNGRRTLDTTGGVV